jgi:REP element-mobilizing transposase RayT
MPEHVHLLFTEPERGNPSLVLAALKQTFAHRLLRELRPKTGPGQARFGARPWL